MYASQGRRESRVCIDGFLEPSHFGAYSVLRLALGPNFPSLNMFSIEKDRYGLAAGGACKELLSSESLILSSMGCSSQDGLKTLICPKRSAGGLLNSETKLHRVLSCLPAHSPQEVSIQILL